MNLEDIRFFRTWFEDYVKGFPKDDEKVEANLRYKKDHSLCVRDYMLTLGENLGLDTRQMFLAEVIGLFHDVGRFKQYSKYHTFKDSLSEDHALLGVTVLKGEQIFSGRLNEWEKTLVFTAILNHNQRTIKDVVDETTLKFCKLIRDADKLDILDQIINFYEKPWQKPFFAVESNHEDQRYSQDIIQGILSGKQIAYTSAKTPADIKLIRLVWLLDINFPSAVEIAKGKGFLERLYAFIPHTEDTLKVFQYVEQRMS
ncbi:putative HD superfamily hydrolase [Desulfosporosinus orientis DSM 765]|uniref:Putative HD superfamily hydrolase n=1 Tax=Desulfosporosinus orientis (strain ATCC 19365 / DSM 765 / NCIMB 8382 / VKM B-1628 / Singapore I) TaxID=768706 RepID=G7W9K7_DESOD|nr:HD domain-containing protein [Desulfosporosinus orientis]AET69924.1 putative HD superfamily hydrolase [Desulfosporosinus orientis DSM 765]